MGLGVFLLRNRTWVDFVMRVVDIPEEEYPWRLRENRLFPHRATIFQWLFSGAVIATGAAWAIDSALKL